MAKSLVIGKVKSTEGEKDWKDIVELSSDDKDLITDYESLLSVVNVDRYAQYDDIEVTSIDAIYKL